MRTIYQACRVLSLIAIGLIVGSVPARAQGAGGIGYWRGVTAPVFTGTTSTDVLCLAAASPDTCLYRITARELQVGANTSPHRFNVVNRYATVNDQEHFSIDWQTQANVALVGTRTAATGTSRPLRLVAGDGSGSTAGAFMTMDRAASDPVFRFAYGTFTTGATGVYGNSGTFLNVSAFTNVATSGTVNVVAITPTYNQASGTAANTDLLVNRTETAVGSGTQNLFDAQVGGISRFAVRNTGENVILQAGVGGTVQSLSSIATGDDPIERLFQGRVATTNATVTTITNITVPTSTTVAVSCTILNRRTGGASGAAEDAAAYELKVVVKNTAGTVAEIAAETVTVIGESQAAWTVSSAPSGNTLLIQVTGAAGNDITWHSHCRLYNVAA